MNVLGAYGHDHQSYSPSCLLKVVFTNPIYEYNGIYPQVNVGEAFSSDHQVEYVIKSMGNLYMTMILLITRLEI